jgi:arginine decarboxylase
VCDEANVPHPQLISESGRAITAQHSVLVMETLGVTQQGSPDLPTTAALPDDYEQPVHDLQASYDNLCLANLRESFHDAQVALDLCMNLFSGGYLPLEQRVAAETIYFALCHRVREISQNSGLVAEELRQLDGLLSDIYFVNFSLFQSLPDSWAIGQTFPIMPIHRLDEAPTRNAVLGDITCDSDGKVDSFICGTEQRRTLRLHPILPGQPYRLGVFFVGAYQEILGDLHNLFGDTHAVHVDCVGDQVKIGSIVKGDTVSEVLRYVQYDDRELLQSIQQQIEEAISDDKINHAQAGATIAAYEQALSGYTYLTHPRHDAARTAGDTSPPAPSAGRIHHSPPPAEPLATLQKSL